MRVLIVLLGQSGAATATDVDVGVLCVGVLALVTFAKSESVRLAYLGLVLFSIRNLDFVLKHGVKKSQFRIGVVKSSQHGGREKVKRRLV